MSIFVYQLGFSFTKRSFSNILYTVSRKSITDTERVHNMLMRPLLVLFGAHSRSFCERIVVS